MFFVAPALPGLFCSGIIFVFMNQRVLSVFFVLWLIFSGVDVFAQNIGGIGVMLAIDSSDNIRVPVIRQVLPNSPASANLNVGMYVIDVDGAKCQGLPIDEVVKRVRGVEGTIVKISVADNKEGRGAIEYTLSRMAIAQPVTDTVASFYATCEQNDKLLRRKGHKIAKAFNSDCGDFYYNFNADTGVFYVRMLVLERGNQANGNSVSADVFDTDKEAEKIHFREDKPAEWAGWPVAGAVAAISFQRPRVATISIKLNNEKACRAVYITVYK